MHVCYISGIVFHNYDSAAIEYQAFHSQVISRGELDYFGIMESWLNFSISNKELDITGYTMLRCNSDGGSAISRGGWHIGQYKTALQLRPFN